ncbi:hypothetical protein C8R45DRAFT_1022050 [Mycena sanguinolenta]|nr:hypothetical protein C8R45DRAFT_1022050 [Mycena sanguinolenta]
MYCRHPLSWVLVAYFLHWNTEIATFPMQQIWASSVDSGIAFRALLFIQRVNGVGLEWLHSCPFAYDFYQPYTLSAITAFPSERTAVIL